MKKLILMTSALTFVGSAAMAEITLSGEATVTYGNWNGAVTPAFAFETTAKAAMQQTAGDLSYGAEVSINATAGTVSDGVIWISGNFGKFSFGADAFDELNNGADYGDIKYEGGFGPVAVVIVSEAGLGTVVVAPTDPIWFASLGYDADSWNFGIETDSTGYSKASVGFDAGNFNVSGNVDTANAWEVGVGTSFGDVNAKVTYDSTNVTAVSLDGKAGDVNWKVGADSAGNTSASVDYSMDNLSIGVAYDSANAGGVGDDAELVVTLGYDASDNLSFEVKFNDANEYQAGFTAGFTF